MIDLVGQKLGRLTIQILLEPDGSGNRVCLCLCECGKTKTVRISNLRQGSVKSCGCLRKGATRKKGYKQSPGHTEKRVKWGSDHPMWKGDEASDNAARVRARKRFKKTGFCSKCGKSPTEIHHDDGEPHNNEPENLKELCRSCHMIEDGRLARLLENIATAQPKGVEAARLVDRNGTKNPAAKLVNADVLAIRSEVGVKGSVLADKYGVSETTISFVRRGKTWKTL